MDLCKLFNTSNWNKNVFEVETTDVKTTSIVMIVIFIQDVIHIKWLIYFMYDFRWLLLSKGSCYQFEYSSKWAHQAAYTDCTQ